MQLTVWSCPEIIQVDPAAAVGSRKDNILLVSFNQQSSHSFSFCPTIIVYFFHPFIYSSIHSFILLLLLQWITIYYYIFRIKCYVTSRQSLLFSPTHHSGPINYLTLYSSGLGIYNTGIKFSLMLHHQKFWHKVEHWTFRLAWSNWTWIYKHCSGSLRR